MVKELKSRLKKLIADNKIDQAIEDLKEFLIDNERLKDELVLVESRLNTLEEKIIKGISDRLEEDKTLNQIKDSLLKLINKISNIDLVHFIENSTTVLTLNNQLTDQTRLIDELKNNILNLTQEKENLSKEILKKSTLIQKQKDLLFKKHVEICEWCDGEGYFEIDFYHTPKEELLAQLAMCYIANKNDLDRIMASASFITRGAATIFLGLSSKSKFPCKLCKGAGIFTLEKN